MTQLRAPTPPTAARQSVRRRGDTPPARPWHAGPPDGATARARRHLVRVRVGVRVRVRVRFRVRVSVRVRCGAAARRNPLLCATKRRSAVAVLAAARLSHRHAAQASTARACALLRHAPTAALVRSRTCCRCVTCAVRHGAKRVVRKRVAARCVSHHDAHRRMARPLASRCTARPRRASVPFTLPG